MQTRLKLQLSAFMFLQYFIWGSWYVSMGTYLATARHFGGQEIGAAYGAFAVGWIAGGVAISLLRAEQSADQFYLAGGISVAFGLFALALPHTPPKKVGRDVSLGEVLGLDALGLMRRRSFAVFVGCMFLICVPLYFYFVNMSIYLTELRWPNIAGRMTLAQVSDVVFLVLLPLMLKRLGYKTTIGIGILA